MARYAPGLPDEPFWNRSRVASLGILVLYVVLRIGSRPGELDGLAIGGLAAAVIWFPEFFADYTGRLLSSAPAITKRTPAGCRSGASAPMGARRAREGTLTGCPQRKKRRGPEPSPL